MVPSSTSGGAGFPAVLVQILHELNDFSSISGGKPQGGLAVKKRDAALCSEKCHRGKI